MLTLVVNVELDLPLVERLDFGQAALDEAGSPITFLPSRVLESVLSEETGGFADQAEAQARSVIRMAKPETVWAPKPGQVGRYRPVTSLSPRDRILLRALTNDLATQVPWPDRGFDTYTRFQGLVLEDEVSHVVVADVASFYFYVDHDRLQSQIVETAARADTARALTALLFGVSDRPFGLPQNYRPSDLLSEIYIAPLQRNLIRHNILAYRHNDDFRLGAYGWGEALKALEALQEEVNSAGLDLNGEKSWILKRETYSENLGASQRLFREALAEADAADIDIDIDPYTGEPLAHPDGDDQQLLEPAPDQDYSFTLAMELAFENALSARAEQLHAPAGFVAKAQRDVIVTALVYFTQISHPYAVEHGPSVVALDPLLARPYSSYLRAIPENEAGSATAERFLAVLTAFRGYMPPWVFAWLLNSFLRPDANLTPPVTTVIRDFLGGNAPSALRARAALVLAIKGETGSSELSRAYESSNEAARIDIAAAVGLLHPATEPPPDIAAIVEATPLLSIIYNYTVEHQHDLTWL